MFLPSFGCVQHPKAGQNTQQLSTILFLYGQIRSLPRKNLRISIKRTLFILDKSNGADTLTFKFSSIGIRSLQLSTHILLKFFHVKKFGWLLRFQSSIRQLKILSDLLIPRQIWNSGTWMQTSSSFVIVNLHNFEQSS